MDVSVDGEVRWAEETIFERPGCDQAAIVPRLRGQTGLVCTVAAGLREKGMEFSILQGIIFHI